jgi:hypothetical protein
MAATLPPELLEDIFLRLDPTTLLTTCQRICKAWHAAIAGSPALQQRLFFEPLPVGAFPSPPLTWPVPLAGGYGPYMEQLARFQNPLLKRFFGPLFFDGIERLNRADAFPRMPWARPLSARAFSHQPASTLARYLEPAAVAAAKAATARRREIFMRKNASWRRMLVTQPAVMMLGVERSERTPEGTSGWRGLLDLSPVVSEEERAARMKGRVPPLHPLAVTPTGGLRMGLLYDLVEHHAGVHEFESLFFRVVWGQITTPPPHSNSYRVQKKLLKHTPVVIELLHSNYPRLDPQPNDPEAFRQFKSEDFCEAKVEMRECYSNTPQLGVGLEFESDEEDG